MDDEWVDIVPTPARGSVKGETPYDVWRASQSTVDAYNEFVRKPSSSPVYTEQGVAFVLRYPPTPTLRDEVHRIVCSVVKCNACIARAELYVRDQGPEGPVFFHGLESRDDVPNSQIPELRKLALEVAQQPDVNPELVVVTNTTYKQSQEGSESQPFCMWQPVIDYYHWTVKPSKVSSPEAAQRMDHLKLYMAQMDVRLEKLTGPEARASVRIMAEEQEKLQRKDHYRSVLAWVAGVQEAAGGAFEDLCVAEKARVRVFALMTGRVGSGSSWSSTHLDFHQAENVVDFLTMPSREALREEMDRRSDPATYQVSQLNRRLADEGVTSKRLIGLVWDGRYTDDLDIHVITPNGSEVYYGNKAADGCTLDFDANVNGGEANPCENVSVRPGKYTVQVNNYTRRTRGEAIPFQVVCRQVGRHDVVHESYWMPDRQSGNKLEVCTHEFTAEEAPPPQMTPNAAARAKALEKDWSARVGTPRASIATVGSMLGNEKTEVVVCGACRADENAAPVTSGADAVNRSFMDLAVTSATGAGKSSRKQRGFLSANCRNNPSTVRELMEHMKNHPTSHLRIACRDHSPGYLVDISAAGDDVRKNSAPAMCHYHDKFRHPSKPVKGQVGNARVDARWIEGQGAGGGSMCSVGAIARVEGAYFLALQGALLPRCDDFPLGGGFYPTDLAAPYHQHRERWAFFHTQLTPSMPEGGGLLMIGSFLTGDTASVYLDGVPLTLSVD